MKQLNRAHRKFLYESWDFGKYKPLIIEDNKVLSESLNTNQEYTNSREVYKVPISICDNASENGNYYSRELWENVLNTQMNIIKGSVCLMSHPKSNEDNQGYVGEEWGDPVRICGVWVGAEIQNNIVWGYLKLSGPYGKDVRDLINNGARLGFSTAGMGSELYQNSDGSSFINPEDYQIIRLADLVLRPAVKGMEICNIENNDTDKSEVIKPDNPTRLSETITIKTNSLSEFKTNRFSESVKNNINQFIIKEVAKRLKNKQ